MENGQWRIENEGSANAWPSCSTFFILSSTFSIRFVSPRRLPDRPLTLTLSPEYEGEGTSAACFCRVRTADRLMLARSTK